MSYTILRPVRPALAVHFVYGPFALVSLLFTHRVALDHPIAARSAVWYSVVPQDQLAL